MSKLHEIYQGWYNLTFPNKDIENLAINRFNICVNCEFMTKRKYCKKCGCYIPAKVRSLNSKCGLKKW